MINRLARMRNIDVNGQLTDAEKITAINLITAEHVYNFKKSHEYELATKKIFNLIMRHEFTQVIEKIPGCYIDGYEEMEITSPLIARALNKDRTHIQRRGDDYPSFLLTMQNSFSWFKSRDYGCVYELTECDEDREALSIILSLIEKIKSEKIKIRDQYEEIFKTARTIREAVETNGAIS